MIHLTGPHGEHLAPDLYSQEPRPGSVLLTHGEWGTAWQRFFSDGNWHPTRGGGSRTWAQLLTQRNLVLVYEAEAREEVTAS